MISVLGPESSYLGTQSYGFSTQFLSLSPQSLALSPLVLNGWMITVHPEFPDEEGPELFSIILPIVQMILKKSGHIFGIEESFSFYSIG